MQEFWICPGCAKKNHGVHLECECGFRMTREQISRQLERRRAEQVLLRQQQQEHTLALLKVKGDQLVSLKKRKSEMIGALQKILAESKELLDSGVLTQQEHDDRRKLLLSKHFEEHEQVSRAIEQNEQEIASISAVKPIQNKESSPDTADILTQRGGSAAGPPFHGIDSVQPPSPTVRSEVPVATASTVPVYSSDALPPSSSAHSQQGAQTVVGNDLLDAALGDKNLQYYRGRFSKFKGSESSFNSSWNWPAFFVPLVWALYRKMYGWFSVLVIYFMFNKIVAELDSSGVSLVLYELAPSVFFGTFGNHLYFKTINNRIAMARASVSEEFRLAEHLRRKGGVLTWVPWAFVSLVLAGIVAAIVIPILLRSNN